METIEVKDEKGLFIKSKKNETIKYYFFNNTPVII